MIITNDDLSSSSKQFWTLESSGINTTGPFDHSKFSASEQYSIEELESNHIFNGKKYVVPLNWKEEQESLPNKMNQLYARYYSLERKLLKPSNATLRENYVNKVQYLLDKKYAISMGDASQIMEKMSEEERNQYYFLPKRMAIDLSKESTRYRFCLDASSLSAIVSKGPMLLPSIFKLLLKFRRRKICIQADLKEAFYSIELDEQSSNKICFLFGDPRNPNEVLQMMKMLFLSMGAPDSTFILNMCIKETSERCETTAPEVSKILAEEVYDDDVLTGQTPPIRL